MNTLNAGGGAKSASTLLRNEKPIGSRMFYFEDEPHDDGTFVHEAVQSLLSEIVDVAMPCPFKARGLETIRMQITQAYPAFFIGRRVSGHKRGLVVSVRYADISSGACISDQISTAVRRIEASHSKAQRHASRAKRANFIADLID